MLLKNITVLDEHAVQLLPQGEHEPELRKYADIHVVHVVAEEHAEQFDEQAVQVTLPPAVAAAP